MNVLSRFDASLYHRVRRRRLPGESGRTALAGWALPICDARSGSPQRIGPIRRQTGIRVTVSDAVQGRVHGQAADGSAREFLNDLTRSFSLDWYFDGTALSITSAAEAQTKFITLKGIPFDRLDHELSMAGLLDERFPLTQASGSNAVIASGPPRFLALVEQAVASLSPDPAPAAGTAKALVVFRGSATSMTHFN